jgi:predicted nuclease of predicted toxin-antitoxin system
VFQSFGFDAVNVRDIGTTSAPDTEVMQQALAQNRILVTADFDFADIRNDHPANYPGIVVLCLPKNATSSYIHRSSARELSSTDIDHRTMA